MISIFFKFILYFIHLLFSIYFYTFFINYFYHFFIFIHFINLLIFSLYLMILMYPYFHKHLNFFQIFFINLFFNLFLILIFLIIRLFYLFYCFLHYIVIKVNCSNITVIYKNCNSSFIFHFIIFFAFLISLKSYDCFINCFILISLNLIIFIHFLINFYH